MKILVVCQHYWPEPYPLADICESLVREGHCVHIITGVPNYPMGHIYPEYQKGKNRSQEHNGVEITRTFTIGRRKNIAFRVLNYFSFAVSSTWHTMHLKDEYDVVFAYQTSPVTMSLAAVAYARKWKKPSVLYCLDLWPASLGVAGIKKNSFVYKCAESASRYIYNAFDTILISSQGFRSYLCEELGVDEKKIDHLPQYADDIFTPEPSTAPKKDSIDFVFAGNIGKAQNLEVILNAAALLLDVETLRWHIVGDGQELENLKALAKQLGLENVIFHGRKPKEEMPAYYAMADAMIVCMTEDPIVSLTLPHKVQTCLAAGKPILVSSGGETARVVKEGSCGICAPAGDAAAFAEAVRSFLEMSVEIRTQMGHNAQLYYSECFSKAMFVKKLIFHLSKYNAQVS